MPMYIDEESVLLDMREESKRQSNEPQRCCCESRLCNADTKPIYLDNAAGCKCSPLVIAVIEEVLTNYTGNASANNNMGHTAKMLVHDYQIDVAEDINCGEQEIIWTSGACEANSMAIKGFMDKPSMNNKKLITTPIEHTSVEMLAKEYNADYVEVNKNGRVDLNSLDIVLWKNEKKNVLVSIQMANSEIGTVQDIKAISKIVHKHNAILHVDATQAYPWMRIDVKDLGIDLMSVSGQKLGAPRGVGFLYCRKDIALQPLIYGSQQDGRRGGTIPTHLIAAFGTALMCIREECIDRIEISQQYIIDTLSNLGNISENGHSQHRLPNIISLTIDGIAAETLVGLADIGNVVIAAGSACKAFSPTPSKVLKAIGLTDKDALSTIRISLGYENTFDEVHKAVEVLKYLIEKIRNSA